MHAVVIKGESDHDGVHAQEALEVADDRDRAPLAEGERLLTPFSGERGTGLGERRTVERHFGCRRASEALELDFGISRQTRPHEGMEGGGTRFTSLNHTFQPKAGLAVLWNNLRPDGTGNPATMHSGEPVTKGHKVIITKWFRAIGDGPVYYD